MGYITITEEKHEDILEHLHKGIHCLSKVAECFEALKEEHMDERYGRREHEVMDERYGRREKDYDCEHDYGRHSDYRGRYGRY